MKKNLVLLLISIIGFAIYLSGPTRPVAPQKTGSSVLYRPGLWQEYAFTRVGRSSLPDYNVSFKLRFGHAKPGESLRVAFDVIDEHNYLFAEVGPGLARLGKVEADFESIIGKRGPAPRNAESAIRLHLKRRSHQVFLEINDALVASASNTTFHSGDVFIGTNAQSPVLSAVRLQPVSEILFGDDFMKAGADKGEWRVISGTWEVKSLDNPSLSANAFTYEAGSKDTPAISVVGYSFWERYSIRAAVRGPGCGDLGLVFNFRNEKNYDLFLWSPVSPLTGEGGARRLCRILNGKTTVIAESAGGYRPGQWYQLQVCSNGRNIEAFIDEHKVLAAKTAQPRSGKAGLFFFCRRNNCPETARFDDVEIKSFKRVADDCSPDSVVDWITLGGEWVRVDGRIRARSAEPAYAITGAPDWKDARISVDVVDIQSGTVGIVAAFQSISSAIVYRLTPVGESGFRQELVRIDDNGEKIIAAGSGLPAGWKESDNHVELQVTRGVVETRINGKRQLAGWLGFDPRGQAGLYVRSRDPVVLDNFRVTFPEQHKPLLVVNPVFAREKSMANWAAAESDWQGRTCSIGGRILNFMVHRLVFYGDIEFSLKVERAGTLRRLRMSIGADQDNPVDGYHFLVEKVSPGYDPNSTSDQATNIATRVEEAWFARLLDRDKVVASVRLEKDVVPAQFRFRRQGTVLVGYVNSRPVVNVMARRAMRGFKISYAYAGGRIRPESILIYSSRARSYTFRKAATDWRVGAGTWQVTNRWQCDPRWTFFSGRSRRLACLWNKRLFTGDICVDFAAGIKMDRSRGARYEYASDLNITISADGQDLNSGYSFLFGGFGNQQTCIFRKGQVVAQTSAVRIPTYTNIHRRWFHIKVLRARSRLSFWIDDREVLSYDDPDPLPGSQVAIWTWNNGVMVAQVRISSPAQARMESPNRQLKPIPACVYDH